MAVGLIADSFFHFLSDVMRDKFISAIKSEQQAFAIDLDDTTVERLADYYEVVMEYNPLLHIVGPCSPEEFAVRHILESLFLLRYLPEKAHLVDVGAGAGLPSIPCLIANEQLKATLIEVKQRKADYLSEALIRLGLDRRTTVVNKQFQEALLGKNVVVTSRALDKFTERLPRLLKWASNRQIVLFSGDNMNEALTFAKLKFEKTLLPMSERRYIFNITP